MQFTNYQYNKNDAFYQAAYKGYKQANNYYGIPGGAGGFVQYVNNNRGKTAVVVGALVLATLTAAYVLSPAYAAGVAAFGAKAATVINSAISAVSGFLVANPLVAPLVMLAAVLTIGTLAYMNHSKSSQINQVKEEVLEACKKDDGNKPKIDDGKLKPTGDASTFLNGVAVAVGLSQAQSV